MPWRMSRSLTVSASRPSRRPVRVEARHAFSHRERHQRQTLDFPLDRLERQAVAVDPVAVVLLQAELDGRQAGDRPGDADRVVDDQVGRDRGCDMPRAGAELGCRGRIAGEESLGLPDGADVVAVPRQHTAYPGNDELGGAAADVEDERPELELPVARYAAKS